MTTMAYVVAGVCVAIAIAGIVWCWWLTRKGDEGSPENTETMDSSDTKGEKR